MGVAPGTEPRPETRWGVECPYITLVPLASAMAQTVWCGPDPVQICRPSLASWSLGVKFRLHHFAVLETEFFCPAVLAASGKFLPGDSELDSRWPQRGCKDENYFAQMRVCLRGFREGGHLFFRPWHAWHGRWLWIGSDI